MKNNIRENPILRKRIGFVGISVFRYLFLISVSYIVIFQLLYMLTYAFRPESDMYDNSIVWVNKINTLENFKLTWEYMDYVRAFITTLSIQVLSALIEVITCILFLLTDLRALNLKEKQLCLYALCLPLLYRLSLLQFR